MIQREDKLREGIEKQVIPESYQEFRGSIYYCLLSQLRKYQGLVPKARPVPGVTFKDEEVFLRKHVTELHTIERWYTHRREVKNGEKPVKCVTGMYNDKNRLAELYGYWQTRPFSLQLTHDGHIPKNSYGNIELFNGPLPPECIWVNVQKSKTLAKNLGIEAVPAIVGFERRTGGSFPL